MITLKLPILICSVNLILNKNLTPIRILNTDVNPPSDKAIIRLYYVSDCLLANNERFFRFEILNI